MNKNIKDLTLQELKDEIYRLEEHRDQWRDREIRAEYQKTIEEYWHEYEKRLNKAIN